MKPFKFSVASLVVVQLVSLDLSLALGPSELPTSSSVAVRSQVAAGNRYEVTADSEITGIVAEDADGNADQLNPLPESIVVARGTNIVINERVADELGQLFLKISVPTETEETLTYWVEESQFLKSLGAVGLDESQAALSFENVNLASLNLLSNDMGRYAGRGVNFITPVQGRLRSPPGMRFHPILKRRKFHAGWDYAAPTGTPVKAAASGLVVFAGRAGGYGNLIKISHGPGVETRYAHLSRIVVRGGRVQQGQLIGKVGSTGRSTGPHLHFEKRVNGRIL